MNVLMFGWELPPHNSGGLGIACWHLANALAKGGARVTFVLPRALEVAAHAFALVFADAGFNVAKEGGRLASAYTSCSSLMGDFFGDGLFADVARYAAAGAVIAASHDVDVIHAHDWLSFGAGAEAKRVTGKPFIAHVHATEFDRTGNNPNPAIYAREKEGMMAADRIIVVSNFTKSVVADHYGIDPKRIDVIHNAAAEPAHDSLLPALTSYKNLGYSVVLFVGRMTLQKGPDYFLKAAKRILAYNPHTLFVMVGSGDWQGQVIQEASDLGISDKVIFTGFLRDRELASLYQSADVFAMPSVSEPFGIAALEAASHGTPVLISRQSGVSEVLSHALTVNFWDVDDMTDKLLSVLSYPSLQQSLGANGQSQTRTLRWSDAAKKCLEVYAQVLQIQGSF